MNNLEFRAWDIQNKIMYPNVQNHIGGDTGFGVWLNDIMGVKIFTGDIVRLKHIHYAGKNKWFTCFISFENGTFTPSLNKTVKDIGLMIHCITKIELK